MNTPRKPDAPDSWPPADGDRPKANITSVTLNSNDPNVPKVLDLDALVELLIGSGE